MCESGVRRLCALIEGLPPDSALHRDNAMWTQDNEIAAAGIELTQMWLAMLVSLWMAKGQKVPPIVPITHPHREMPEPERKATADPTQLARVLGGR